MTEDIFFPCIDNEVAGMFFFFSVVCFTIELQWHTHSIVVYTIGSMRPKLPSFLLYMTFMFPLLSLVNTKKSLSRSSICIEASYGLIGFSSNFLFLMILPVSSAGDVISVGSAAFPSPFL